MVMITLMLPIDVNHDVNHDVNDNANHDPKGRTEITEIDNAQYFIPCRQKEVLNQVIILLAPFQLTL